MSNENSASTAITYRLNAATSNDELNALFSVSWPRHQWVDFQPVLNRALAHVTAYQAERLIGFVYLAWDGGIHAFLLDPTVHPDLRRRGIGRELVRRAVEEARQHGIAWVHVDYEPSLHEFYRQCSFRPTLAGLIQLS